MGLPPVIPALTTEEIKRLVFAFGKLMLSHVRSLAAVRPDLICIHNPDEGPHMRDHLHPLLICLCSGSMLFPNLCYYMVVIHGSIAQALALE
jgi:hypothetical protein